MQREGKRRLARCRRDDAECRNKDRIEVDGLEVLLANCPDVSAESKGHNIGID